MNKISEQELELRKWAFEKTLKHYGLDFFQKGDKYHSLSAIINNAKRLAKFISEDWDKPLPTSFDESGFQAFEENQTD